MNRRPPSGRAGGVVLTLLGVALIVPQAHAGEFLERQRKAPSFAKLEAQRLDIVRSQFEGAQAAWPPKLFIRVFKQDKELELWGAPAQPGARWVLVRTFPICRLSGKIGPKLQKGDGQVPEGFYRVTRYIPRNRYHFTLRLNYPNRVDRWRARGGKPGGKISIHGSCVSTGCIPLKDAPMEDLYLAAAYGHDAGQEELPVHIFPCRLDRPKCAEKLAHIGRWQPKRGKTWQALEPGFRAFQRSGCPPVVRALRGGDYGVQVRRCATAAGGSGAR